VLTKKDPNMKNLYTILAATAALSTATVAYADEEAQVKSTVEMKDNGGYESNVKSEEVTSAGTAKSTEKQVDIDVNSNGLVDKNIKIVKKNDPKGLMNGKKDVSETEIEEKEYGGYKQTTTRKITDANGTNTFYKTITDVSVDTNGNVTSTATTEKTTDPKGWFNKTTVKSTEKTVNGKVIEKSKKVD
jgi:hypothetical protein